MLTLREMTRYDEVSQFKYFEVKEHFVLHLS